MNWLKLLVAGIEDGLAALWHSVLAPGLKNVIAAGGAPLASAAASVVSQVEADPAILLDPAKRDALEVSMLSNLSAQGVELAEHDVRAAFNLALATAAAKVKAAQSSAALGTAAKSIAILLACGLGLMSLGACTAADSAAGAVNTYVAGETKAVQKNVQGANDNAAAIWAHTGCAIPYGEIVRNGSGNPNLPAAVIDLCGAPPGFTMIHSVATPQAITIPQAVSPAPTVAPAAPTTPAQ